MDIEKIAKKVLCKRVKKIIYNDNLPLITNIARFEWIYNSPLNQWEDRIWVLTKCHKAVGKETLDKYLQEYIYSK